MGARSLLVGMIVGGVIAGVSTLLVTPSSGKQVRQFLKDANARIFVEIRRARHELQGAQQNIMNLTKEGSIATKNLLSEIKPIIEDWKREIEPEQFEIKQELHQIEKEIAELELHLANRMRH